jgi:hypothetical protein
MKPIANHTDAPADGPEESGPTSAESRAAMDDALGGRRRHEFELTTNYRNPVEIFDLAASVIRTVAPDAPLPTPVRATGVVPEHRQVSPADLPAAVRSAASELLAQVEGTVGVITPAGLDVGGGRVWGGVGEVCLGGGGMGWGCLWRVWGPPVFGW